MKSRRSFLIQGATLLALFGLSTDAFGKKRRGRNRRKPRKPIKLGKPSQLPVVKRVGSNSITVGDKDYSVRDGAAITVNGEKAELSDIRVGMQAMVSSRILEFGRGSNENVYEATRIKASRNVKPKSDNNGNKKK
jgi:hypothetical protein